MKLSNSILFAAVISCALCVLLSIAAVSLDQYAYSRIDPYNWMALCLDNYHTMALWAFLLYDLLHVFVIAVFALVLAQAFSWEAWMGGGALIVSTLADMGSVSVRTFFLLAGLRALALGQPPGLAAPEAGFEVICSTLDFANASFGLVGTLFLGTAAIKAKGMSRVVGWFLLAGLPLCILQFAEVGLRTPWTLFIDTWLTPLDEVIQQTLIGIALWTIIRQRQEPHRPARGEDAESTRGHRGDYLPQRHKEHGGLRAGEERMRQ
jgi:hypothetical protein